MSQENLRNAILKRKATLAELNVILSRPPGPRVTPGSRQRLQEKRLHEEEVIADLERELLLWQYHRSRNDPSALTAIEQKLSERGTPVRRPEGYATLVEIPSSPVKGSSHVEKISFKRLGDKVSAIQPFSDTALLNTYESLSNVFSDVRTLVLADNGKATPAQLKKHFRKTELGIVANQQWEEWIDVFNNPREKTTANNYALSFLKNATALSIGRLKNRCSKARQTLK